MTLRHLFLLTTAALLLGLHPCLADDASPADVLKDKGLVKQGGLYLAGGEAEVLKDMRLLRVSRAKLDTEMKTRAQMEQRIKLAERTISQWEADYTTLNDRMSTTNDAATQNQYIARINATIERIKRGTDEKKQMEAAASKVGTQAKITFADGVTSLGPKADAVSKVYKDAASDDGVKAALDKINETARPKMRLGPTTEFTSAANLLKKWRTEVEDETIPIKQESGTPTLEVTLNGTVTKRMILDSGASVVQISAEVADELKMTPGPADPRVKMSIADGSTVEGRLMHLKSVRVGHFVVEDVECVVLSKAVKGVPLLLGDAFLSHFIVKLDAAGGELHLMELSGAKRETDSPGEKSAAKGISPPRK
jgi:predicted aspartyl protease